MHTREKGAILVAVILVAVIFTILGLAVLTLAEQEAILGRIEADKTRAFYLAEAGLAKLSETLQKPVILDDIDGTIEGSIEQGDFSVVLDTNDNPCYAISTGISGMVQKKIRVQVNFLAAPFENAIYAMNSTGGSWALQLRGTGNPVASRGGEKGGKDIISGNIVMDGDVYMFEESRVNPAPKPNTYGLRGDVGATGGINVLGSAVISGARNPNAEEPDPIDVVAMDYAQNNTHDIAAIFQRDSTNSTTLPTSHPLRDVFAKNPDNRSKECASTTGDDYFLEPVNVSSSGGDQKSAPTPLHLGSNRIYYVDGNVWIHNNTSYGFTVDGIATIVATGDIHICDNIKYKDSQSALGLVALGKYDDSGNLISGGNIYFGDPRYGTMYTIAGLMFSANDFLYNADTVTNKPAEPTTGFMVNGSFAAMNKVIVERDWYTLSTGQGNQTQARPARYDSVNGSWVDSETGAILTSGQISTLRHYQMIVNYDERVRSHNTQPPGLPRGGTKIFAGFTNWEEL